MGRAQGQLRGAVAEHTDRFQALFGARRGSGGDRHREDLGLDLEPPQRLVFVRERLAAGDLKPGFAWRSEPAMCALPTSTMKTQYGLPAWFDTVRELARQVAVLELSEAQWVLGAAGVKATLLYGRAVGEVDRKEDVAETVMGLYNQLCTLLDRTFESFGPVTAQQASLIVVHAVRADAARRVGNTVRHGRVRSARAALGASGYTQLYAAIQARERYSGKGHQQRMHTSLQIALEHAWPDVLDHYHSHRDELRALPPAKLRRQLREGLAAECYTYLELELPDGLELVKRTP